MKLSEIKPTSLMESEFSNLKDNKTSLDDKEREEAMSAGAKWGDDCAIWKSKDSKGKLWYCCNTHRAWAKAPSLKGAISKYHKEIEPSG